MFELIIIKKTTVYINLDYIIVTMYVNEKKIK